MKFPLGLTFLGAALAFLSTGIAPGLARADNCDPVTVYLVPGQGIRELETVLKARIVGNPDCRVYLYAVPGDETLTLTDSYGLVGDEIHLYGLVVGYSNRVFYQVYFPSSGHWAWLPEEYVFVE
jgi:hypothetical protein